MQKHLHTAGVQTAFPCACLGETPAKQRAIKPVLLCISGTAPLAPGSLSAACAGRNSPQGWIEVMLGPHRSLKPPRIRLQTQVGTSAAAACVWWLGWGHVATRGNNFAAREGCCCQRSERLLWHQLCSAPGRCAQSCCFFGVSLGPRSSACPEAAGGTHCRDVAAFITSGMQSQRLEWEFMVKVPSALDGLSCRAHVSQNELLLLGRHLLLSRESQQRVINHRAGQSCLLHAGHGFSTRAGRGFGIPSTPGQPGRPAGCCSVGVQAR